MEENEVIVKKASFIETKMDQVMQKTAMFSGTSAGTFQQPYPSPFLSLSDTKIPKTPVEIFRWCKYFYTFDPIITGSINALATFPITEIFLEEKKTEKGESKNLNVYKENMFNALNIVKFVIEVGIDYFLYGNCFVFGEMWKNPDTGEIEWKRVTRLDPAKITIDVNSITGEKIYKWSLPDDVLMLIKNKGMNSKADKEQYDKLPDIVKKAGAENKALIIKESNIYHFSRPSDSMGSSVWGTPVGANVIKLLMYRNKLRRAQEAIADEHIVPQRIYCMGASNNYDPMTNFDTVAKNLGVQLEKTVRDPNYKVISPVPIEVISLGGDGKMLMLNGEIDQVTAEILAGMGVPREFIFGGVSYSGGNIALRILENQFITYRLLIKDFLQNFIIKQMARARGEWRSSKDNEFLPEVKMTDLKMLDDVQQKQLVIQLNQEGKCTDEYLYKSMGWDPDKVKENLDSEMKDKIQRDAGYQLTQQKLQIDSELQLLLYKKQIYQQAGIDPNTGMTEEEMAQQQQAQMQQESQVPQEQGQQGQEQQGQEQQVAQQQQAQAQQAQQQQAAPKEKPKANAMQSQIENIVKQLSGMPEMQKQKAISTLPPQIQKQVVKALGPSQRQQAQSPNQVQILAEKLMELPPQDQSKYLGHLDPVVRNKVAQIMNQAQSQDVQKKKKKIDMRPMPEQRPPRRESLS